MQPLIRPRSLLDVQQYFKHGNTNSPLVGRSLWSASVRLYVRADISFLMELLRAIVLPACMYSVTLDQGTICDQLCPGVTNCDQFHEMITG